MEVDFGAHVIQIARNCGNRYRCLYCDEIFPTEDEMVQHLRGPEWDGGHVTGMLITYDNFNRFLNVARPPTTSYSVEESIGRAISEEVASNSEGEGDDPLCISSAEKRKAIDMELMCPTCKRSRYHKNVVEESTAVAYDMKEHVPMKERRDVLSMLREEELDEYAFNIPRKENSLAQLLLGRILYFSPQSMSRFRLLSSLCLFPGATLNDIPQSMSSLRLLSGATLNDIPQSMSSLILLSGATLNDIPQSMSSLLLLLMSSLPLLSSLCLFPGATWNDIPQSMSSLSSYECHAYQ